MTDSLRISRLCSHIGLVHLGWIDVSLLGAIRFELKHVRQALSLEFSDQRLTIHEQASFVEDHLNVRLVSHPFRPSIKRFSELRLTRIEP